MATNGLSKSEIADRTAIQAIWVKYWEVTDRVNRTPVGQRAALLSTVAVKAHVAEIMKAAADFDKKGWDNYGVPGHRPYWGPPVEGEDQAIMGDCMDFSHSGRLNTKTRVALTIGVARSNIRGVFERVGDRLWRVSEVQIIRDNPC